MLSDENFSQVTVTAKPNLKKGKKQKLFVKPSEQIIDKDEFPNDFLDFDKNLNINKQSINKENDSFLDFENVIQTPKENTSKMNMKNKSDNDFMDFNDVNLDIN